MTPDEVKAVVEQVLESQSSADNEVTRLRTALQASEKEVGHLREVIAAKDALIEAQNMNLSLLRGGSNRVN